MQSANVYPHEVEHFDKLASSFWDPHGPFKTLHQVNPVRLNFIRGHRPPQGQQLLDCGCGGGILSEALATDGAMVTGIDLASSAIAVAKQHAAIADASSPIHSIRYLTCSVETLATQEPSHYDMVTMMELIEHVPDPYSLLQATHTLLKTDGLLFVSTLNRTLQSFIEAIVLGEYLLRWIPKGTHHYQQLIKASELIEHAHRLGFRIQGIKGIRYNPLYRQFVLAANIQTNYIACFVKQ